MIKDIQPKLKRLVYRLRHDYLSLNNIVFAAALLITLSWIWSSIDTMQHNYQLQQSVDRKKQQLTLEKLYVDTLALEGKYYTTLEYQELAVRERLGKVMPGERVLIVPSTDEVIDSASSTSSQKETTTNFQEWMNFLFGNRKKTL